jgi:hypothetical protein
MLSGPSWSSAHFYGKLAFMNDLLSNWHTFVETGDPKILNEILAEDVKFHSPFVWKPKEGKEITTEILLTATTVFEEFRYVREINGENNCMLEFEARVGVLTMRGVDILEFGKNGKIVDLEVMIRPVNALQAVGIEMSKRLSEKKMD